jgi:hypothetical protein
VVKSGANPKRGRCAEALRGAVLVALGKKWHRDCFRCNVCDEPAASSFIEHEGAAVCKRCHADRFAEKCDACRKGLVGAYVNAMGGKYHRDCFRCCACGASVASKYVPHEGKPYCDGCHASHVAEKCACGCGQGMTGKVTTVLGQKYIEGHFRCAECGKPPRAGKFVKVPTSQAVVTGDKRTVKQRHHDKGGGVGGAPASIGDVVVAVCEGCYADNHADKCAVCSTALVSCSYVQTDLGESMCNRCKRAPGTVCDDCGRCVRREWSVKQQRGGHRTARRQSGGEAVIGQCESCAATAVHNDAEAAAMLDRVIVAMEKIGARGAPNKSRIPLELVDADVGLALFTSSFCSQNTS